MNCKKHNPLLRNWVSNTGFDFNKYMISYVLKGNVKKQVKSILQRLKDKFSKVFWKFEENWLKSQIINMFLKNNLFKNIVFWNSRTADLNFFEFFQP